MYIAVCDDQAEELTALTALLEQWQAERRIPLRYRAFRSAGDMLDAAQHERFTLYLLDVMMPGIDGMEAAREIRAAALDPKIVFLTSSPEYAVESYAVEAYSYLLKPASADNLFPVLDKLFHAIQKQDALLTLRRPAGVTRLPFSSIVAVEVRNKHLMFYLEDGSELEIPGALSEYEGALLSQPEFIKVHRAFVVNDC